MESFKLHEMEHRWGTRVTLAVSVNFAAVGSPLASGILRNASLSGGYVETASRLPQLSIFSVRVHARLNDIVVACVVRTDDGGMGLEWLDPSVHALSTLLSLHFDPAFSGDQKATPVFRHILPLPDQKPATLKSRVATRGPLQHRSKHANGFASPGHRDRCLSRHRP